MRWSAAWLSVAETIRVSGILPQLAAKPAVMTMANRPSGALRDLINLLIY
jgi:hypothetical protein